MVRRLIQFLFLAVSVLVVVFTAIMIGHKYCPYSVICFGLRSLNPEAGLRNIEAIIAGLVILLSTLFIGRLFCGYICPLGTVSEYLNYLNPFRNKVAQIPFRAEKYLRLGKYALLLFNIVAGTFILSRAYYNYCPVMILTFLQGLVVPGIIVLSIIGLGSIFIARFWCRYLCPYAALMNCFQFIGKILKIKRRKIYRNLETCIDCYCCEKVCQMNIKILDNEYIEDANCIYCLDCIKVCPRKDCLTHKYDS